MLTVVPGDGSGHVGGKDGSSSLIDEIVREGARRMLAEARCRPRSTPTSRPLPLSGARIVAHLIVRDDSHHQRELL